MSSLQKQSLKAWRDRLAWRCRHYRRTLGHWPEKETLHMIKHSLEVASHRGLPPPALKH